MFAQIAAEKLPQLSQAIQAATGTTTDNATSIAANILNTQGSTQLTNPGNFSPGNQAAAGGGQVPRPVMPGSLEEMNQIGAQIAGPRSGPRRTVGADMAPGGGNY